MFASQAASPTSAPAASASATVAATTSPAPVTSISSRGRAGMSRTPLAPPRARVASSMPAAPRVISACATSSSAVMRCAAAATSLDVREPRAREGRRLAQVRLDQRRAAIRLPRQALRIDEHGSSVRRGDGRAAQVGREHALRVVGQDQRVAPCAARRPRARGAASRAPATSERAGLAVEADHLLVARDDARLARREPLPVREDSRRRNAEVHGLAAEQLSVRVLADDRAQARARTERDQRLRHVRRAAEHELLALDREHGHRRLRRDPLDLADHVGVERGVADHHHAPADHGAEQLAHARDRRLAKLAERRLTRLAATHSPLPRYLYQIRAISKKATKKSAGPHLRAGDVVPALERELVHHVARGRELAAVARPDQPREPARRRRSSSRRRVARRAPRAAASARISFAPHCVS